MWVWLHSFLSGSCVKAGRISQPETSTGMNATSSDVTSSVPFQIKDFLIKCERTQEYGEVSSDIPVTEDGVIRCGMSPPHHTTF